MSSLLGFLAATMLPALATLALLALPTGRQP